MKLSKIKIEVIEHRLEVPDAIYDACESALEAIGNLPNTYDFMDAVHNVEKIINGEFEVTDFTNVEWLIFEDAIEGSTLADAAQDQVGYPIDAGGISQQKANAYTAAAEDLYDEFVGARA